MMLVGSKCLSNDNYSRHQDVGNQLKLTVA